jgi:small basic protein
VDKNALVVGSLIGVVCEKVVAQSIEHYLLHCLVARILVLDHMFSLFGASW